jgi:hypothetical protein
MSGSNLVTTETNLAQNAEVIRSARPLEGDPVRPSYRPPPEAEMSQGADPVTEKCSFVVLRIDGVFNVRSGHEDWQAGDQIR